MKKGCLIAALILLAILLVAGIAAYYHFNGEYGLSEAPAVSHATIAGAETKFRAALQTEGLARRLNRFLPEDLEIPVALPWSREELLEKALPREFAVLATPKVQEGKVALEIFANERRGGPVLADQINASGSLQQVPGITWGPGGLRLEERGVLRLDGQIPLSKSGNQWVNKRFLPGKDLAPLTISGEHQLEFVLDNRHGEAMLLIASVMETKGQSWDRFIQDPMVSIGLESCTQIQDVQLMADWKSMDRIVIQTIFHASKDAGEQLTLIMNSMLLPKMKENLKQYYAIYFAGEMAWHEAEGSIVGEFTLSGIESMLHRYLETGSLILKR